MRALLLPIIPLVLSQSVQGTPSVWAPGRFAYITTLGRDTVAIEAGVARVDSVLGTVLRLEPQLSRAEYRIARAADGSLRSADLIYRVRDGRSWGPAQRVRITVSGDSAIISADGQPERRILAVSPALSLLGSGALISLAFDPIRTARRDSANTAWLAPFGGPGGRLIARRAGEDLYEYRLSGGFARVRFDRDGSVDVIDGAATTLKERITRVRTVPFETTETEWLRRGVGGALSSRDTLRARVGDAEITVDYGRPSVRGRDVFAVGVLGDTLWRTGANAATQVRISRTLVFGDQRLAPGDYSIFTRISPSANELIFSGRTGIWGTQYRAADDVLRVPMLRTSAAFTERFEISVEATDSGGVIRLRWADVEFRVPFVVAPPSA